MDRTELLNREFLPLRAKILEIAAALDRIDRSGGSDDDRRFSLVRQALAALDNAHADRAEQVQLIFSRPYEDDWQERFAVGRS